MEFSHGGIQGIISVSMGSVYVGLLAWCKCYDFGWYVTRLSVILAFMRMELVGHTYSLGRLFLCSGFWSLIVVGLG